MNQNSFLELLQTHYGQEFDDLAKNRSNKADWTGQWLADWLDCRDPLRHLHSEFHIPRMATLPGVDPALLEANGEKQEDGIYLCGNSLGLQPKCTEEFVLRELRKWAEMGVHGHFNGDEPWTGCDERLLDGIVRLVGANSTKEVALLNATTVNIHLLFSAFFRPTPKRFKVLLEAQAFPSDHYAVESQLRQNGLDPGQAMILVQPRPGEECLRTEDILALLDAEGPSIALVFIGAIHYYTGQLHNVAAITEKAHEKGCLVGWDLAHAVANVPLELHRWNVDFAVWCNYKYGCAGPGGVGGIFVHERHHNSAGLDAKGRLLGWWGHRLETRFLMTNQMDMAEGAAGFRLSTPSPLLMAGVRGFLHLFSRTSMPELRQKSLLLTGYLEFLLDALLEEDLQGNTSLADGVCFHQITPRDTAQRGCQLSLKFNCPVNAVHAQLVQRGVVVDERQPDVLRVAPLPMYNSFRDVWRFVQALKEAIQTVNLEMMGK